MKEKLQPKPSYANKERSIYDIFFLGEHPKKKYDKCYPKNPTTKLSTKTNLA